MGIHHPNNTEITKGQTCKFCVSWFTHKEWLTASVAKNTSALVRSTMLEVFSHPKSRVTGRLSSPKQHWSPGNWSNIARFDLFTAVEGNTGDDLPCISPSFFVAAQSGVLHLELATEIACHGGFPNPLHDCCNHEHAHIRAIVASAAALFPSLAELPLCPWKFVFFHINMKFD